MLVVLGEKMRQLVSVVLAVSVGAIVAGVDPGRVASAAEEAVATANGSARLESIRRQLDELTGLIDKLKVKEHDGLSRMAELKSRAEAELFKLNTARREKHYIDSSIDLKPYERAFAEAEQDHRMVREDLVRLRQELSRLGRERERLESEIADLGRAIPRVQATTAAETRSPSPGEAPRAASKRVVSAAAVAPARNTTRAPMPVGDARVEMVRDEAVKVPAAESAAGSTLYPDREESRTKAPPEATGDRRAQPWVEQSRVSAERGDWLEAIRTASLAISYDPGLAAPYINRAWAYGMLDMLAEGERDCLTALALAPQHGLSHNNCGFINERRGDSMEAQEAYEASCVLGSSIGCSNYRRLTGRNCDTPRTAGELIEASYLAFQRGDWAAVVRSSSLALLLSPSNATALLNRSGAYANLGAWEQAMADVEAALRSQPESGLAYNNKGFILEGMGQNSEALLYYQMACRRGASQGCVNRNRLQGS